MKKKKMKNENDDETMTQDEKSKIIKRFTW